MSTPNQTGQTTSTPTSNQGPSNPFESAPPATREEPVQQQTQQAPAADPAVTAPSASPSAPDASATPAQPASPVVQLSPDDLRQSIVDGIVAAQKGQTPQAPQEQPMSPEQFRQHYGIPPVDAQVFESIFGVPPDKPERVVALDNLMQGFMRAGLKMGQDLFKNQIKGLEDRFLGQISPLLAAHQQAIEQRMVEGFNKANPDLVNEHALVTEVRDALIARGVKFSSAEEMYKKVGDATRQLLTKLRGQPAGGQNPGNSNGNGQPASQPANQPRQMTPSMQGGRGGSGSPAKSTTTAEAVFGAS